MRYLRHFEAFEEESTGQYDDLKNDLKEIIEKSLNSKDEKTLKEFISAYTRDSEKNQIEGLINDSDVYDFYLKYRNNIDQLLSDKDFFQKKPSEMESFSLYDYVIVGTKEAIGQIVEMLNKDLS